MEDMHVDPFSVKGKIDYSKLIERFGTLPLTEELRERLKRPLPVPLRRGFYFSHRDLDKALGEYEKGKPFFIYTGIGPSGKMHIGHLSPFLVALYFQKAYGVNVYIMLSDDEKVLTKSFSWDEVEGYAKDNALTIAALGFDEDKTFIFRNSEYLGNFYPLAVRIAKKITLSTAKATFGFSGESNIGIIFYPALQIAPTFFEKGRPLIPCAIDQDPYFRLQRDIAESLGGKKAALLHSKFLPPLKGWEGKMSSSDPTSAIWLDDSPKEVRKKIMKYAFSGGQPTVEEHRQKGGNTTVDVAFQYLHNLFMEDDKEIERIREAYEKGEMLTGELKATAAEVIGSFLQQLQERKAKAGRALERMMYSGKLAKEMWERRYW